MKKRGELIPGLATPREHHLALNALKMLEKNMTPDQQERRIMATINGTAVRLLAESITRDRRFGDARLNVGGRGRVAWLASPYDPVAARSNASAATAQQLAGQALEENGVPIGWGLDWQKSRMYMPSFKKYAALSAMTASSLTLTASR